MTRSFYLRLISLVGFLGNVLRIIGCFLPFTIWRDGLNRTTEGTYSLYFLWTSMVRVTISQTSSYSSSGMAHMLFFLQLVFILFTLLFPVAILIPLLTTLAGLFNRGLRLFLIPGLVFAWLGLLPLSLFAWMDLIAGSFCAPEAMSAADCGLVFAGPGLWLTFSGFLLSLASLIALALFSKEKRPRFIPRAHQNKE